MPKPSATVLKNAPPCAVAGCPNPAYVRRTGYCSRHNAHFRRHGDPLGGRTFTPRGEAAAFYREVVLTYDGADCLIWLYSRTKKDGYAEMILEGRNVLVSRQVCIDTHGPPPTPKHESAHRCGKGHLGCVNRHHLRWATPVENSADKRIHGTILAGESLPASKLTEADVIYIRSLPKKYDRQKEADRLSVSTHSVSQARIGATWRHVPGFLGPRRLGSVADEVPLSQSQLAAEAREKAGLA